MKANGNQGTLSQGEPAMEQISRLYRVEQYQGDRRKEQRVHFSQVKAETAEAALRAVLVNYSCWMIDRANDSRCTAVDMTTNADSYNAIVAEAI